MDLIAALGLSVTLNLLLFLPAFFLQTDKLTDLAYGLTFIVLALLAAAAGSPLQLLLALLITAWGVRLASYLVIRIGKMQRDKRFDGMREDVWKFLGFWALQGLSVWIIMIAALLFFDGPATGGWLTTLGLLIWVFGFAFESIADSQKHRFLQDKKNEGKWIDAGLWRYSRHPNYFGEILVWVGVYLFALPSLQGAELLLGLLSPLWIAFLLLFVSGLPQLERSAEKKWGHVAGYRKYRRETSVLVPWFRGSSLRSSPM